MSAVAAFSMVSVSWGVAAVPAQAATPVDYQGHVYSSGATAATADKPQSKAWYNAGWWALMVTPGGTVNIYKLQADHTWRDTGVVVDTRASSTGDALYSGGKLYVVSRTGSGGSTGAVKVYRFSYSGGAYTADADYTHTFPGGGTESATIDKDSTGRLWVTFTRASTVYVSHSETTQKGWSAPFRISGADTAVSSDDISAVIAFENKIGVMWSDQASNAMRFAYHVDGAPDTSWTTETVASGTGIADDHINIKSMVGDSAGRIYAAVKTSKTVSTDPIIYVVTRGSTGGWTLAPTATVADKLTRPQLALDSTNKTVYIMQSTEGGGTVYYKSAAMSNKPAFSGSGKGSTFISFSGAKINNVSTTKDPVTSTTGLVAIAADEFARRYYHAEMSLGGSTTPPPPPPNTRTVTANPVADSMVQQATPTANYGDDTTLLADREATSGNASTAVHSYLRFTLPALSSGETITSAKLRLNVSNGTTNGPAIYRTDPAWSETSVTWNSGRPARTSTTTVGNYGSMGVTQVETSVSGLPAGGDVSFELAPEATDGMGFGSREATSKPQLVLTITS